MTRLDYPATWPDTQIIKSVHSPFNWRRPGVDNPAPLNADVRKTNAPNVGGTPRQLRGFSANNGTIHGLTTKADKLLAVRPDHRKFKLGTPNADKTARHAPAEPHGGAYSKAAPGPAPKVVPAHLVRAPAPKRKKVAL